MTPNFEERREARQQKDAAKDKEHKIGYDEEKQKRAASLIARVAHAQQLVGVHLAQDEHGYGERRRHGPAHHVKDAGSSCNRFVTPFPTSGQEPREREDDPPDGGRRGKKVLQQKGDGAIGVVQAVLNQDFVLSPAAMEQEGYCELNLR